MPSQLRDMINKQRREYERDLEGPRLVTPSFFLSKDRETVLHEVRELLFAIREETKLDYITNTRNEIDELIDLIERS